METALSNETEAPVVAGPERRGEARGRVLKGATLSFNKGFGAFECQVRNLSRGGARLNFGETFAVPGAFDLAITGEAEARRAQVRWRTTTALGVSFSAP